MKIIQIYLVMLLLIMGACKAMGQHLSKQDTVLYLVFDNDKYKKYDTRAIVPETLKERWESLYVFRGLDLYDGYELYFLSLDRKASKTLTYDKLKNLPVVTVTQLHKFISQNYRGSEKIGYYASSYFKNLKHIYIVELDKKNRLATITEVRLDITIE